MGTYTVGATVMVAVGVLGDMLTAALQNGAAYTGRADMSRASRSFAQDVARGSTAAELLSPAMTEATSARLALVCIFAGKNVSCLKDRLYLWLMVCLVLTRDWGLKRVDPGNE